MEENTVELYDYLRVVWKRKILIIVVILVCIGMGVGVRVKNSGSEKSLPVISYQAEVVVKIGQKLLFTPGAGNYPGGVSTANVYIEPPEYLVVTLPFKHGFKVENALGYHLDAKRIGETSMLKLTLKGSDIEVERVLKELVDVLIDEHSRKTEVSIAAFTNFIKKLEADANIILENIAVAEASIKEIQRRAGVHLEDMVASETEIKEEKSAGGQSAFMNMLYLKTIDLERDLRNHRNELRNTQWQLILHQTSIGDLKRYSTTIIGKVKSTAVTPKVKGTSHIIIVAGVAGLMMSLFIAFFREYIEESKSKRKGK
jgi:uncharacterized protein YejL (UPF0352 family)